MEKKLVKAASALLMIIMVFSILPINMEKAAMTGKNGYDDPYIKIDKLEFSAQKDSITVSVDYRADEYMMRKDICFCMYAFDKQTARWSLVGGWQSNNVFVWEPDANNIYTIVVYAGYRDGKEDAFPAFPSDAYWQEVSRPQMGIQVTGDCAVPTPEGLLYGCTSNINPGTADAGNYFTTCYIWSHDRQAWITQSSYRAWDSAWYRTATLPKGTYMMYNCTEKLMPDGSKRKLSCRYYLFDIS